MSSFSGGNPDPEPYMPEGEEDPEPCPLCGEAVKRLPPHLPECEGA
jgi:hypothetical protein